MKYDVKNFKRPEGARMSQLRGLADKLNEGKVGRSGNVGFCATLWALAKIYNGSVAIVSLIQPMDREDLQMLDFEMTCLTWFMDAFEFDELKREYEAVCSMQKTALLDIHHAGGIDALEADAELLASYIKVRSEVVAMYDRVHNTYLNTVTFKNIFRSET